MSTNKTGRQVVSQKVALNRALLVLQAALTALQQSSSSFIAALAKDYELAAYNLQMEDTNSSSEVTRIINAARVASGILAAIGREASGLEQSTARTALGLAEYFLREHKSRAGRNKVDLVALVAPDPVEAKNIAERGPLGDRIFFELGMKVSVDGREYRIIGIDKQDHSGAVLQLDGSLQPAG